VIRTTISINEKTFDKLMQPARPTIKRRRSTRPSPRSSGKSGLCASGSSAVSPTYPPTKPSKQVKSSGQSDWPVMAIKFSLGRR